MKRMYVHEQYQALCALWVVLELMTNFISAE